MSRIDKSIKTESVWWLPRNEGKEGNRERQLMGMGFLSGMMKMF